MIRNTGPIISKRVCEYTGDVIIERKPTMRDASLEMDRAALEKKAAEKAKAACDES